MMELTAGRLVEGGHSLEALPSRPRSVAERGNALLAGEKHQKQNHDNKDGDCENRDDRDLF